MSPVLVIAEAGVNHDGSTTVASSLVAAAAEAGADAIKFQTFTASKIVSKRATKAPYQFQPSAPSETQFEMLQRLELSAQAHETLVSHAREHGIEFMSSGFDEESLDFLHSLGVKRVKIPSGEITNLPYLRHIARLNLPILLSTGMATLLDIERALEVLTRAGAMRDEITVMHCVTSYPVPFEEANLKAIQTIKSAFDISVGYSDHTLGIEAPISAVALGAQVVEKHLTLDRNKPGPDHAASLEPEVFGQMVTAIRNVELALGSGAKTPRPCEIPNIDVVRRSLVASRNIRKGDEFSADNLIAKRPGTGVSPMLWDSVVGTRATRDYTADEAIDP